MRIKLKDITMAYHEVGDGIPVLFIHGYPLNNRLWLPQLEGLKDCAHLIAPDLRGHGNSTSTGGVYAMDLLATDCNQLLNELDIHQKVILCGLSMGGYIAFSFYQLFPDKIAGIILTSTRASPDSPEAKDQRRKTINIARKQGILPIVENMAIRLLAPHTVSTRPEMVHSLTDLMLQNSLDAIIGDLQGMMERPDSIPLLPEIQVPVQIIHGAQDSIVPLSEAIEMQSKLPFASLCVLPDSGHLTNLEQPELFNNSVRAFLQQF